MKLIIKSQLNTMKRVKQFGADHPLAPANALVTTELLALSATITLVEMLAGNREQTTGTFRGASAARKFAAKMLRDALGKLSKIAKTLDVATYPDVAAQLRMGKRHAYQDLADFARSVIAVVEPIKQVFIDYGSPATVVEDLEARLAALDTASRRKFTGITGQVGKTRALTMTGREGMSHVRKLDAVYSQLFAADPELDAAWKSAKRLHKLKSSDVQEETPAPDPGSGNGSQPVSA